MRTLHYVTAPILLAIFVAGGIVAPAVHELEHSLDYQRKVEVVRLAHAGHHHNGHPGLETDVATSLSHAPCLLCNLRSAPVIWGLTAPLPGLRVVALARLAPAFAASISSRRFSIRGPPTVV